MSEEKVSFTSTVKSRWVGNGYFSRHITIPLTETNVNAFKVGSTVRVIHQNDNYVNTTRHEKELKAFNEREGITNTPKEETVEEDEVVEETNNDTLKKRMLRFY